MLDGFDYSDLSPEFFDAMSGHVWGCDLLLVHLNKTTSDATYGFVVYDIDAAYMGR